MTGANGTGGQGAISPSRSSPERQSELPVDPDVNIEEQTPARRRLPLHLSPAALGPVAAGRVAGTAGRYYLSELIHPWRSCPSATFLINILGALLLCMLLEGLARRGPDVGVRRRLRLLLGTGFCGAFTTYSTLALDTDQLLRHGQPMIAVGYALATVTVTADFAATTLGIWLASHDRHPPRMPGRQNQGQP